MKFIRFGVLIAIVGAIISFSSCSKKDSPAPIPTVSFTNTAATYAEDKGTVNIEVSLSAKASADVTVNYSWTSPDTTAFLGADFKINTPSPLIIAAGETTGNIIIQIIDDKQLDGDNALTFNLATVSANAKVTTTATAKVFDLTITDNDELQADRLQVDLIWWTDGKIFGNINAADLNLRLQQNVVYTRDGTGKVVLGTATGDSGTSFTSGSTTSGFETVYLNASDPIQKYFLRVDYVGGSGTINFALILNGMGRDFDILGGQFPSANAPVGTSYYYGAFGPFLNTDGIFDFTDTRISGRLKNGRLGKSSRVVRGTLNGTMSNLIQVK